jgi:hypothetical protein
VLFPVECDLKTAADRGKELAVQYQSSDPYPHIKLDDFTEPEKLDAILADVAVPPPVLASDHQRSQERLKVSYNPDSLPQNTRAIFRAFNSRPFVAFLEEMTGIRGLIPDPFYLGGGVHEVKNGGHLNIHADFNLHPFLKLERRINVLIYLNRDWRPEYGGQFEIWDRSMSHCVEQFEPLFNRCVVFNTTSDSYHGNPRPVSHPQGLSRKSLALYYYTATWEASKRKHTTQFRARPGSRDGIDWRVRVAETVADLVPPLFMRLGMRALHGMRKTQRL